MKVSLIPLCVALLVSLSACVVGPNYHRPPQTLPDQFRNAPLSNSADSIADTQWFDLLRDEALKRLVETALQQNFDIRIAAEHVLEARAQIGLSRANSSRAT